MADDENPYAPINVSDDSNIVDAVAEGEQSVSSAKASYNAVSDLVVGVNVRKKDNLFQLVFILISIAICALLGIIGALVWGEGEIPWWGGALMGAFPGLVLGFFLSGIYLMIYRARRHMKGKHD